METISTIIWKGGNPVLLEALQVKMELAAQVLHQQISPEEGTSTPAVQVGDPFQEKIIRSLS